MEIKNDILDRYSNENIKRILEFTNLLRGFLEIHNTEIAISSFEKKGFNYDEIFSFIKIINSFEVIIEIRNIEMQKFIDDISLSSNQFQVINIFEPENLFFNIFNIKPEKIKTILYLRLLSPNTYKILDVIIKEIERYISIDKKVSEKIRQNKSKVEKIEILTDKTQRKKIKVFVNGNYGSMLEFNRGKFWTLLYSLAENKYVEWDKGFFDYFNSNKINPLYKKHGFLISQILKKNGDTIQPNINITLITERKITHQKKNHA